MSPGTDRLPFGLCCWGMTYSLGVAGGTSARRNPAPMSALDFLELAARLNLCGVEIGPELISATADSDVLAAFRRQVDQHSLVVTLSGSSVSEPGGTAKIMATLDTADRLGARIVRITLSSILCGDRRPIGGIEGWKRLLDKAARSLTLLAREAGARSLRLAIENHQDASAEDLVWLCEAVGNPALGITLDCGNPLAVGEAILPYARRVLPHVVNVHLKDYTVHQVDDGYVLARCALGEGIVPLPELLELFADRDLALHLELAALDGRRIPVLTADYWYGLGKAYMPSEDHPIMRLQRNADATLNYQTPWERKADTELVAYEMMQVKQSVAYLAGLKAGSVA